MPGHRRLFDRAVAKIGGFKSEFVGKCRGRAVRAAIDGIIGSGHSVENRLRPRFAVKFGLKPSAAIDRVHKQIGHRHRNIEIRQARLIVLGVDKSQNIGMRDTPECPYSHRDERRLALRPRSSD